MDSNRSLTISASAVLRWAVSLALFAACDDAGTSAFDANVADDAQTATDEAAVTPEPDAASDEDAHDGDASTMETEAGPQDDAAALCSQCTAEHPCTIHGTCECSRPDVDNDGDLAVACGGHDEDDDGDSYAALAFGGSDCDDNNNGIHPEALEICDGSEADAIDEDCDPGSVGDRDVDGDGYVDIGCTNPNPEGGKPSRGPDCDDSSAQFNPDATETCDGIDNDCDERIDESPEGEQFGLRSKYWLDADGDGFGDSTKPIESCIFPARAVPSGGKPDFDDDDPSIYPDAPEICDGKDNDDDESVDDHVYIPIEFRATDVECIAGHLEITDCPEATLWCPQRYRCEDGETWCDAKVIHGCDVDATRMSSCGECQTSCQFSCGTDANAEDKAKRYKCDEVDRLSLGASHSCTLTQLKQLACWGRGREGQLGNDQTVLRPRPVPVFSFGQAQLLAAGGDHACAVLQDERALYCWGSNAHGELGHAEVKVGAASALPVPVDAGALAFFQSTEVLTGVKQVAAGRAHTCAVVNAASFRGAVLCWGLADQGRLGSGPSVDGSFPSFVVGDSGFFTGARDVALGANHSCAIAGDAGDVFCWGDNSAGQLGLDPQKVASSNTAQRVPGLSGVVALGAGTLHTCARTESQVLCWGENAELQLGRSSESTGKPDYVPQPVDGLHGALSQLTVGAFHSCARGSDGSIWCWGKNDYGQLGVAPSSTPSPVTRLDFGKAKARDVAAGDQHTCAAFDAGPVRCWGYNAFGQLGIGQLSATALPTVLSALEGSIP